MDLNKDSQPESACELVMKAVQLLQRAAQRPEIKDFPVRLQMVAVAASGLRTVYSMISKSV